MKNITLSGLMTAPVLVELFRGHDGHGAPIVERVHRGLICVMSGTGEIVYSVGDVDTRLHMRSCAKPFQILPMFESGFFDPLHKDYKPELTLKDVPLLMSSHSGQDLHTNRVEELLHSMGLSEKDLRCGVHAPQDEATKLRLQRDGTPYLSLHNNCSGKHVAMLMVCQHFGFDMGSYEEVCHPLQQWIKKLIANMADLDIKDVSFGVDGCSLPSWAIPLAAVARLYARLTYWQHHLPKDQPHFLRDACSTIVRGGCTYPEYLAGDGRFDTELMRSSGGLIFSKTGADGMQALSIGPSKKYPDGLGIAIKIADGDSLQTIRPLLVKELLTMLGLWPHKANLDRFMPTTHNLRGITTGGVLHHLKQYQGSSS